MLKWSVSPQENGMRLQDFLKKKAPHAYSSREFKRQIELNCCLVNGVTERFSSKKLVQNDKVEFDPSGLGKKATPLQFDPHQIIFEDNSLLIYNKSAGMTSDKAGILKLLSRHGLYFLTHRLDKDTTGLIILAKNKSAEASMVAAFRQREVAKIYYALVDGCPHQSQGIIENRLGKIREFHGQVIYGKVMQESGLAAKTFWYVRKKSKNASLIECHPVTGRTHQIRVHLSELGYPILGDHQYGIHFKCKIRPPRLLLHAAKMSFPHPITQQKIIVEAPLPEDFKEVMKLLWH